jgi:hypothetical protein
MELVGMLDSGRHQDCPAHGHCDEAIRHAGPQKGRLMKPRITMLTLGVDDLERSLAFYANGLGLPTQRIVGREFEHGAVAFFHLRGGVKLAIFSRDDLTHDTGLRKRPRSPTEFSIGHNVRTE